MEDVSRETLRVHAHEHTLAVRHVAEGKRDVLVGVHVVLVAEHLPGAERRGKARLGDAMDEPLVAEPVRD